jgi:SAM-dependent methyltransferase
MTRRANSIEPAYFEALYRASGDPWHFETSDYERAKYIATLDACGRWRTGRILEVGCSIGLFTAALAPNAESVLGIDVSPSALEAAQARCAKFANVRLENRAVPDAFPRGSFDLIVLSEVLYYLDPNDLAATSGQCLDHLAKGGAIIACHWLGETDYPLSGNEASERFAALVAKRLQLRTVLHNETYRLERFETPGVNPSASRG